MAGEYKDLTLLQAIVPIITWICVLLGNSMLLPLATLGVTARMRAQSWRWPAEGSPGLLVILVAADINVADLRTAARKWSLCKIVPEAVIIIRSKFANPIAYKTITRRHLHGKNVNVTYAIFIIKAKHNGEPDPNHYTLLHGHPGHDCRPANDHASSLVCT